LKKCKSDCDPSVGSKEIIISDTEEDNRSNNENIRLSKSPSCKRRRIIESDESDDASEIKDANNDGKVQHETLLVRMSFYFFAAVLNTLLFWYG